MPRGQSITNVLMAKPERPIPPEATNIHGITTAYADERGQPRDSALHSIVASLCQAGESTPVVGHNVRFDLTIVDREMRRLGIGSLGHERGMVTVRVDGRQVGAFHVIDTLVLDKWVDPYRKGRRTLDATAAHYGVPIRGDAHTAEADALAAGRVAWAIAKRCRMANGGYEYEYDMDLQQKLLYLYRDRRDANVIGRTMAEVARMTLPYLHRNQIDWAREQAARLREYFARNPDKGDPLRVSDAWPLEPVGTVDAVTDLV
jgi:DNA polymerase III subunit epsilon